MATWNEFQVFRSASVRLRGQKKRPIFDPMSTQVDIRFVKDPDFNPGEQGHMQPATRPALSLEEELALFRTWAASRLSDGEYSCWESDYGHWPQLKSAFGAFLQQQPFQGWGSNTISDLLYIIARDNDSPSLAHAVAEEPERLLFLAQAAVRSTERDAKWQFAVELGSLGRRKYPVEPLLLALFQDEDEYVRRQALMALGRMRSPLAEGLVSAAWGTGDEYQRMAALQVLRDLNSPQLTSYLDEAEQDDSQYLRAFAARLKAG